MLGLTVLTNILCTQGAEFVVSYSEDDAVVSIDRWFGYGGNSVLVLRFFDADPGIVYIDLDVVFRQLMNNIHDLGVAQVWTVFLEGQPHYQHAGTIDINAALKHALDQLRHHIGSHAVVQTTACQDDFRVVADTFSLVGQVIGVYANTVAAHQPWAERQEVPLGTRSL